MDMELELLLDRQSIHDATVRYCRGIDRLDVDLVRSAYHDDGFDDHGLYRGRIDVVAEQLISALRGQFTSHSHLISNQSISLRGRHAHVETYFVAIHVRDSDGQGSQSTVTGRYVDSFEKRKGNWRISRRVVVYDSRRVDAIGSHGLSELGDVVRGRRDKEDPSYRLDGMTGS